jgi:tetratricopeptide (TPR) repeat protein
MTEQLTPQHLLARDLLRRGDLEGARAIAEAGVDSAANRWPYRIILLELQRLRGEREGALHELNRLERMDPPADSDLEYRIGIKKLRGYYSGLLGRYRESHQNLQEAEAMAREAGLLEALAEVYQCQAMIFFLQQDYIASDRIFRLILEISEQISGWYFRGCALWGIGKNLMIQAHHEEAIPWLQKALTTFEEVGAKLLMATVWGELAVCQLGLGNDELSLDLMTRAAAIEREAGAVANYQVALANIGNVYLYRNEYATAISYYQQALAIAREIKDPVSIRKWTYNINLAYMKIRAAIDEGAMVAG